MQKQRFFPFSKIRSEYLFVILLLIPVGIVLASWLFQRYQARPVVRHQLEEVTARWLRAHSSPSDTVYASRRIGYLAVRPTLPWPEGLLSEQDLLEALVENHPAYCVSIRDIAWDRLTRTGWFQERYELLQSFNSPYEAASPFSIWGYRSGKFDLGEFQARELELSDNINITGLRYWPDRIKPGEAVYVTLYLQATRPLTRALDTVARVLSPSDGANWAQQEHLVPHGIPVDWWAVDQALAERFVLTTTAKTPVGAHHLDVFVEGAEEQRVPLGYVVVPWGGEMSGATALDANLGGQITLRSFETVDSLSPGERLDVTLYWEATRPPDDDYVVFVQLLDADGRRVAGHDGVPGEGRYSTWAWIPGEIVRDVHHLFVDPELPGGTYRLLVGMYNWPDMERLPVWNREGVEQPDQAIELQSICLLVTGR